MNASTELVKPAARVEVLEPVLPSADLLSLNATTVYKTEEEQTPYLVLLRRYKGAVCLIFAVCLAAGAVYAFFAPKSYKTETVLEITGLNHDYLGTRAVDVDAGTGSLDGYLETQIGILQNEAVLDRVVHAVSPTVSDTLAATDEGKEAVVRGMLTNVKAKEEGQSDLVRIGLTGPDPHLVAQTANQLTRQYIEQGEEHRQLAVTQTGSFLAKQLGEAKVKSQQSEEALQQYARASGIVLTDDTHEPVAVEHLRELQQGLAQAELDAANSASQAEMISRGAADALPEAVNDPALRDDLTKLTELKRQLADQSTTLTPENYRVQKLQAQIDVLESAIKRQQSVIASKLSIQNLQAVRRKQLLELTYREQLARVTDQGSKQVRFNMLKHDADTNNTVYQSLLQQARQAGVIAAMRTPNARVVSEAKTPLLPYSPKLSICGLISALVGAVLSGLYILITERRQTLIQAPGESGNRIDCQELAVIPQSRLAQRNRSKSLAVVGGLSHPMLGHWKNADSTFMAEAYRSAVASILYSRKSGPAPKVLLITSPLPQCGKTVTCANLAVCLGEGGRRVLLVDGDLRRPALPQVFGMEIGEGLGEVLDDEIQADARSLIRPTSFKGVSILSSGNAKGSKGRLLHSAVLGDLIQSFSKDYDFVLIDAPPLLGIADARLLARHSSGLILVCRAGRTVVEDLQEARRLLSEDHIPVLGTILNDYNLQRERFAHYNSYLSYVGTN